MGSAKSWLNFALDTTRSMWHFHMDLLELWRGELSSVSLGAFVCRSSKNLAVFSRQLGWYDTVLKAFIWDTGIEPLVSIYDGEIRSDPIVYAYMRELPLYLQVSGAYYNARFEDLNQQFTDQIVGNLALLYGLFIPTAVCHALAEAPKDLFEARAHHILQKASSTSNSAGDFIKWAAHSYSVGYKNYSPFMASPDMWRVYNPLIDLWYWTLASHIHLYSSLRAVLPPGDISPFIPGQQVRYSVNDEPFGIDHLTGDGYLTLTVPTEKLTAASNTIRIDTYSLATEIEVMRGWILAHLNETSWTSNEYDLTPENAMDADPATVFGGLVHWTRMGGGSEFGIHFGFLEPICCAVTIDYEITSLIDEDTNVSAGCIYPGAGYFSVESIFPTESGSATFHVPPRHCFGIGLYGMDNTAIPCHRSLIIKKVTLTPEEPLTPEAYNMGWAYMPDYDTVAGTVYPESYGWPPEWF